MGSNRRAFLRSACQHCLAFGAMGVGVAASAQTAETLLPARFSRPALDTDEGGLWSMMDREEAKLRRSSFEVRDSSLNQYLQDLVCRLGGEHCPDLRVHVVRTPQFNASMAPNGMMQVWTGLMLRVENEAQLAAVIGHEMGHYLERHTLERLRDVKSRAAFAQFLGAFGLVGAIGQLGVLASAFAFSREQEQRADRFGIRVIKAAGYDGTQAAQVWDNLLGELRVRGGEDAGRRSPMLATHPPAENRRDELLSLAGPAQGRTGAEEYRRAIAPHRRSWVKDEIKRGQFEESLVLFNRMIKSEASDVDALFARAEILRLRNSAGDIERARADLQAATGIDASHADAYRALGLVERARSDAAAAAAAFERYLQLLPDAPDAGLIRTYLSEATP